DAKGKPLHQRGVSTESGIYFLGLPWQSRRGSSFIWGVWHDAKYVADHIAIQRTQSGGPRRPASAGRAGHEKRQATAGRSRFRPVAHRQDHHVHHRPALSRTGVPGDRQVAQGRVPDLHGAGDFRVGPAPVVDGNRPSGSITLVLRTELGAHFSNGFGRLQVKAHCTTLGGLKGFQVIRTVRCNALLTDDLRTGLGRLELFQVFCAIGGEHVGGEYGQREAEKDLAFHG
nr:hypothetical protein [Tanacetum cinerariifolium]